MRTACASRSLTLGLQLRQALSARGYICSEDMPSDNHRSSFSDLSGPTHALAAARSSGVSCCSADCATGACATGACAGSSDWSARLVLYLVLVSRHLFAHASRSTDPADCPYAAASAALCACVVGPGCAFW